MPTTPSKGSSYQPLARRWLAKLLPLAVIAFVFGFVMPRVVRASFANEAPAGFGRGVAHGALMPLAMPQLLFGKDVTIYAPENSGRTYKLGYTVGVNACGAVFFGLAYWRWNRWRRSGTA